MDFKTYQTHVARTLASGSQMDRMVHMALGIGGESGEVIEPIKKHAYSGKDLDHEKLAEEIGDLLYYVAGLCEAAGLDFETVARFNVAKLQKRYPGGFVKGGGIR